MFLSVVLSFLRAFVTCLQHLQAKTNFVIVEVSLFEICDYIRNIQVLIRLFFNKRRPSSDLQLLKRPDQQLFLVGNFCERDKKLKKFTLDYSYYDVLFQLLW